jgi:hypothetical protein
MRFAPFTLLAVIGLSCVSTAPPPTPEAAFDLEVTLNDVYNRDLTVSTLVHLNQPFMVRCNDGKIDNTFWGRVHPEKNGKYPLDLSICEWESKSSNTTGAASYTLDLGKTQSGCFISSFVYSRSVTLRPHVPAK